MKKKNRFFLYNGELYSIPVEKSVLFLFFLNNYGKTKYSEITYQMWFHILHRTRVNWEFIFLHIYVGIQYMQSNKEY